MAYDVKIPDLLSTPTLFNVEQKEELRTLTNIVAKYFIARNDVKAIQRKNPLGAYMPINKPWDRMDFVNHFTGAGTFGHYLLDTESKCKIFAFDIDLSKKSNIPTSAIPEDDSQVPDWLDSFENCNPREVWLDRRHPARTWIKCAMREVAAQLSSACAEYGIPTITSYTGSKGLHVYGLIGQTADYNGRAPAEDAYEAARMIIESTGQYEPSRGNVFYKCTNEMDLEKSLFEIEVYPKQTSIENKGGYGNLLRLPYGINLKSPKDRTFFIDETLPFGRIEPASWEQILSVFK